MAEWAVPAWWSSARENDRHKSRLVKPQENTPTCISTRTHWSPTNPDSNTQDQLPCLASFNKHFYPLLRVVAVKNIIAYMDDESMSLMRKNLNRHLLQHCGPHNPAQATLLGGSHEFSVHRLVVQSMQAKSLGGAGPEISVPVFLATTVHRVKFRGTLLSENLISIHSESEINKDSACRRPGDTMLCPIFHHTLKSTAHSSQRTKKSRKNGLGRDADDSDSRKVVNISQQLLCQEVRCWGVG